MTGVGAQLKRYWRIWLSTAGALTAGAIVLKLPLPAADLTGNPLALRISSALASAAIVAAFSLGIFLLRTDRRRLASIAVSAVALVTGGVAFLASGEAQRTCTARYPSQRAVVIGTELTPLARQDLERHPDQTWDDMLFDAAGDTAAVWTRESIDRCRRRLAATWFLPIPLLMLCIVAAAQAVPTTLWPALATGRGPRTDPAAAPAADPQYDVFLSYRHEQPDRTFARQLAESLEIEGYRVAIDERDFRVNESFLVEMERCIRQSRFTVAIVSARYLQSGNCEEEAIICKILDMGERRRRLIPIFLEQVPTPVWLHGIVGIDATNLDPLMDPLERLKATLGART